jgi:hypothetical protein
MAVKYVKDFEFASKGPKLVRGYMRGGSCGYAHGGAVAGDKVSTGKTPGKGPEHTLGFAKGGKVAKAAPKGLSVMIAVGTKKAPPAAKKGASPVPGVALGMKKGGMAKVEKVMGEYGKGELHSGSKTGPVVKNPKQAVAIALSEARKAGAKLPVKKQAGGLMGAMTDAERRMVGPAMTDAEAKRVAGRSMAKPVIGRLMPEAERAAGRSTSYLSPKAKASLAKAPTRAQFDAMIAAQTAAPVITPAQRRAINNETMIGRKKGGMVKC